MAVYDIAEISERIKPIAKRYGINKVVLFGSYARGEATAESDIDLMISYDELKGLFALSGVFIDFEEALGKSIDLISETSLTSTYTNDIGKDLYNNIKNEGVTIYVQED